MNDGKSRILFLTHVVIFYMLALANSVAMAQQNATLKPVGVAPFQIGQAFWVEVHVGDPTAVTGLYGISFKLKSDRATCTYVDGSAANGGFLGASALFLPVTTDRQTVDIGVSKTAPPGVSGSGVVAKAQFISSMVGSVSFLLTDVSAVDQNGTPIAMSVETSSITVTGVPPVPSLLSPSNGATGVATNTTLSWNSSSGATSYRLQVSTDQNFSTTVYDQSSLTGTSQAMTGLLNGTTYYWHVSATNAGGTSAYTTTWSFTTQVAAPPVPTLSYPGNGSTGISTSPTLSWNASTGATSYRLQVSTDYSFNSTVVDQAGITGTSYQVTVPGYSTTYYWRVNATNSAGTSAWQSTLWSFTTQTAPVSIPTTPVLSSPSNGSTGLSLSPTLSWNASTGATSYGLQVSTNSSFTALVVNQTGISGTSYPVSGLSNNTTYYWHVNATNSTGTSDWQSAPWSFRTTAGTIEFLPSNSLIDFGKVMVNLSKDSTLMLYNRTSSRYGIDSITFYTGKDYYLLSNSLVTTLRGGDSAAIHVRFNPHSGGFTRDTLYIWHNFTSLGFNNPYKIVLTGTGSTNALIPSSNFVTVDNVAGPDGYAIASPDSSYVETGPFWQNASSADYGGTTTGHRRSPNLSGSANGSSARWTFSVDTTAPYLVYHYLQSSPTAGSGYYVHLRKFGSGNVVDSMRYDLRSNYTRYSDGSWFPLMMHWFEGVGPGAGSITIGADRMSSIFLHVDAIRILRSSQKADLEFGRRVMDFSLVRVPEEFGQVTIGMEYAKQYRLYNLGCDTLVISDIKFYPTNNLQPVPWSYAKNYTSGTILKIPPMTVNQTGKETGGYFDLQLAFQPYQEGLSRDSMVIFSNDENEPKAYIILYGEGINYNFIMNASFGNTEPHYNAPAPPLVPVIPTYRETANGSWANSPASPIYAPFLGSNSASRVNVGDATTLPHQAFYQFQLPEIAAGNIFTDGRYILEYGGPVGSSNAYTNDIVKVTHTFGVPPDSVYFNSTTVGLNSPFWLQIGGTAKTFFMAPGGQITVEFRRDAQTDAAGGVGYLRTDLLRIRKVPTGPLIGVTVQQGDVVRFGDVSFRNPGGSDGKANLKEIRIGSRGECQIVVKSMRFRNGSYFSLLGAPSLPLYMRALIGDQSLTIQFAPDRISPNFVDTLEVLSNSVRDSALLVAVNGNGIGGIYTVDDDGTTQEVYSSPAFGGVYVNGWDKTKMNNWQVEATNTVDSIGHGKTLHLLPIYFNPNARFEWYPAIPTDPKDFWDVLMNVAVSLPRGYAKGSPAARYRVFSTGGSMTKDTMVSQNSGITTGASNLIEINLGNHHFLRGGRDVTGGGAFFGHVQMLNDTAAVSACYGTTTNFARRDTFALLADAVILRELVNPLITSAGSEVPTKFALSQNYPNPFNPTTAIEFSLAKQVPMELKIYDLLGREVAVLMRMNAADPGRHIVRWDGRNRFGQMVATGIYFYRLVAGEFVETKKMMLLH